jgi:hypothetical protein
MRHEREFKAEQRRHIRLLVARHRLRLYKGRRLTRHRRGLHKSCQSYRRLIYKNNPMVWSWMSAINKENRK